jgi:hypothetical protein
MTIQSTQGVGAQAAAVGGAAAGNTDADGEKFADLLRTEASEEKKRIAEIGLVEYTREQRELRELMRVLNAVRAESPTDIREKLDEIIERLKQDRPKNVEEAYERIAKVIEAIDKDAPNHLKKRMEALFLKIKSMMEKPEDEVEQRERRKGAGLLVRAMLG